MRGRKQRITAARVVLGMLLLLPTAGAVEPCQDDTAQMIANKISADTGRPASDFLAYATRLARTLSQLSPEQQVTVFGEVVTEDDPDDGTIDPNGGGDSSSGGGSAASLPELLDAINQLPPMNSSDLHDYLLANSPLDGTVLAAAINRDEPMGSSDLVDVLEANHPLTHTVLNLAINRPTPLGSSDLRDLLIQNSPLPSPTLGLLLDGSAPLNPSHLAEVLDAQ